MNRNMHILSLTLSIASLSTLIGLSPGQEKAPAGDKLQKGVVAKVGDPFKDGLKVQVAQGGVCYPMLLYFDKNTSITFADKKKATVADLKPGRWVSFKSAENLEPMGIYRARVAQVVLDAPDDGKFPHNSLAVSRDRKLIATVGYTHGRRVPRLRFSDQSINLRNSSNRYVLSCGPADASG